jgi:glutathione S-transferase
MKLLQIPFSHNCVKVRIALERKGIAHEIENIAPMDRSAVFRRSNQGLVPVLEDGDRVISDSTRILLYLEETHPIPSLLPADPARRAECLVLEDWADRALMAVSRRIAYFNVLATTGLLGSMFFPEASGWRRTVLEKVARRRVARRFGISGRRHATDVAEAREAAALAVARLGAGPYLFGAEPTLADLALAAMAAPLAADPGLRRDPDVRTLLEWGEPIVGPEIAAFYRGERGA